jgi:hypothetical protein
MAFASQSEIKAISRTNDLQPNTLPSVEGRKGTGLKFFNDPACTGKRLAAASAASIRAAQTSSPEAGAAMRFAGVSMKQSKTTG